jgi:hypothetical protein
MGARTLLPLLAALFCSATAGASFVSLVPKVRAVEAVTLFASAFCAGVSFATTLSRIRQKKPQ